MRRLVLMFVLAVASLVVVQSASAADLYIPDYGSGPPETISGYSTAADGTVSALAGSPFGVGPGSGSPGGILGLGFTPDGAHGVTGFLFNGGVLALKAAADGSLSQAQTPISTASVTGVAVSPDGRFAYTTTRHFNTAGEGILGYSIGPTGELTALGGATVGGEGYDLAITPNGRWLFANDGASIDRFAISAVDGKLTNEVKGVGTGSTLQVSPDGRFLFAGTSTSIRSYAIGEDGSLTEVGSPLTASSSLFGYFAVAADGRHLYMPDRNGNAIDTVAIAADGALSEVEATSVASPTAIAVTPDGRFLYVETGGEVRAATIGSDGDPVLLAGGAPWGSGEPERIALRPDPAPTASFVASAPTAAGATTFDASGSHGATRYEWSFGDGTTLADGGANPSHTYSSSGTYAVTLTVYDDLGCSGSRVYTGQSTICPANPASRTSGTVEVPAPAPLPAPGAPAAPKSPALAASAGAPPTITSLSLTRTHFAVRAAAGSKQALGTVFLYGLDKAASVTFTIERRVAGRLVGGACKPKTKANGGRPKCVTYRAQGTLVGSGIAGGNRLPFSGRVGGGLLAPGAYRATAVAQDLSGGRSAPRAVSFTVKAPVATKAKQP